MNRVCDLMHEAARLERASAAVRRVIAELNLSLTAPAAEACMDDVAPALDALLAKITTAYEATHTEIALMQGAEMAA